MKSPELSLRAIAVTLCWWLAHGHVAVAHAGETHLARPAANATVDLLGLAIIVAAAVSILWFSFGQVRSSPRRVRGNSKGD